MKVVFAAEQPQHRRGHCSSAGVCLGGTCRRCKLGWWRRVTIHRCAIRAAPAHAARPGLRTGVPYAQLQACRSRAAVRVYVYIIEILMVLSSTCLGQISNPAEIVIETKLCAKRAVKVCRRSPPDCTSRKTRPNTKHKIVFPGQTQRQQPAVTAAGVAATSVPCPLTGRRLPIKSVAARTCIVDPVHLVDAGHHLSPLCCVVPRHQ